MFAMPGLRAFSVAGRRDTDRVSCDVDGAFVGDIPLLERTGAVYSRWSARPLAELNKQLSARYRLPVDISTKAGALSLIASALNRGDLAMAAIAAVQMRFPDPPPLTKRAESPHEINRRAAELFRSGLLKFWDPAKHPRTGAPPNPGWFAPVGDEPNGPPIVPVAMPGKPWDKPVIVEGGGGGGVPRGTLELPFPSGLPRVRWPWQSSPETPSPAPKPWAEPEQPPTFPFMEEQPPQLAPFTGGKTSGIFRAGDVTIELQSGYDGPAQDIADGSPGFNLITKGHVEGHAAAVMQQQGISEGTLEINNPKICSSCESLLPSMLPPGAILNVILPDGTIVQFKGVDR